MTIFIIFLGWVSIIHFIYQGIIAPSMHMQQTILNILENASDDEIL